MDAVKVCTSSTYLIPALVCLFRFSLRLWVCNYITESQSGFPSITEGPATHLYALQCWAAWCSSHSRSVQPHDELSSKPTMNTHFSLSITRTVAFTYDHAESPKKDALVIFTHNNLALIRAKSSTLIAVGFAPSHWIIFALPLPRSSYRQILAPLKQIKCFP